MFTASRPSRTLFEAADDRLDSGTSAARQCTLGTHDFELMLADVPRPSWRTAGETVKSAFHVEQLKRRGGVQCEAQNSTKNTRRGVQDQDLAIRRTVESPTATGWPCRGLHRLAVSASFTRAALLSWWRIIDGGAGLL